MAVRAIHPGEHIAEELQVLGLSAARRRAGATYLHPELPSVSTAAPHSPGMSRRRWRAWCYRGSTTDGVQTDPAPRSTESETHHD